MKILPRLVCAALLLGVSAASAQQTETTPRTETTTPQESTTTQDNRREGLISPGGLFFEPILQTNREQSEIKTSELPVVGDDTSGTTEGYGFGAKLGFHLTEIFFVGADARYARQTFRDSFYDQASGDLYNVGPTAGVQMPVFGLRLLGTYVAAGEFNPEAGAQNLDLRFRDARGWRYGAGLRIAAVSVNLEYQDLLYDTTEIESLGAFAVSSDTAVDYSNRGYTLSLSFPLEL